ncbi:MAG: acyl-CoA dehydrogenase family protein, partial [Myxococcales bacterium]
MDFSLSEEQELLTATLRRFLDEECPVTRVRELVAKRPGHDGGTWKELCELGVAGLLVPEEHGGSGLALLDAAVAAESLAWGVAPGPFLGSAVMAPIALRSAANAEQQARLLPRLATGDCRIGVAANELVSRR